MKSAKQIALLFALILVIGVCLIQPAEAILNTKTYDPSQSTLTIKDWLGLSSYLTAKLISNTNSALASGESVLDIKVAQDMKPTDALDAIQFYNKGGGTTNKVKDLQVTYEVTEYYSDEVLEYGTRKVDVPGSKNGSWYNEQYVTGKHTEVTSKDVLKDFYSLDELKKDTTYRIHITANKPANKPVDWVGKFGRIEAFEFAWWNVSFASKSLIQMNNATVSTVTTSITIPINITTNTAISNGWLDASCKGTSFTNSSENQGYNYQWDNLTHASSGCNKAGTYAFVNLPGWSNAVNNNIYWYYDATNGGGTTNAIWNTGATQNYTAVFEGELFDRSANGYILTDDNIGFITSQGKFGYGYNSNNGAGEFISSNTLIGDKGAYSVSLWMYPTDDANLRNVVFEGNDGDSAIGINYGDDSGTKRIVWNIGGGSCIYKWDITGDTTNRWFNVVGTYDNANTTKRCKLYINGQYVGGGVGNYIGTATPTYKFTILASSGKTYYSSMPGVVDDVEVFGRAITGEEISAMYSAGAGTVNENIGARETASVAGSTTLIFPANKTVSSNNTLDFNCSSTATTAETLTNMTVTINYGNGSTHTHFTDLTGATPSTFAFNFTETSMSDGNHTWHCKGYDTSGLEMLGASNRTIMIDTTSPIVTVVSPVNSSTTTTTWPSVNTTLNATSSDTNLAMCWLYNETVNVTYNCNEAYTNNYTAGWHTVIFYANDSVGNVQSNSTTFLINVITQNVAYSSPVNEGTINLFNLTVNTTTAIASFSAGILYNNTFYSPTITISGTSASATVNIAAPATIGITSKNFYFNYSLNGAANTTTATYAQVILPFNLTFAQDCGALTRVRLYDFKDEQNLTAVANTTIDYNFVFGITDSTFKTVYGKVTDVDNISICINATASSYYTVSYGELQYSKANYEPRRFYLFNGTILNASLPSVNSTFYHVVSTSGTVFIFKFTNTQLTPYDDKYSAILHWYPDLNEYKTVDMGKTDAFGQTIMKVIENDVDYRIALYEIDGTLIKLANPARIKCESAPCTYNLQIDNSATSDYPNAYGLQDSLTFNRTTHVFTYIWNDPAGTTQSIRLHVYKLRGDSETTICDSFTSGVIGAASCDASAYNGTLVAKVYRLASPQFPIASMNVNTITSIFRGSAIGLIVTFFIFIFAALIGSFSPPAMIVLSIVGLLPALIFKSISLGVFAGLMVAGVIFLHLITRANR